MPTLTAVNRTDLAFATGFVHAQDRFFEMDLSRRLAAGELSELFGAVALEQDQKARLFRFRTVAKAVIAQADPAQRAALEAYTRGVNAGLAALRARPFEYWLLGQAPAAWRPEDGLLVAYAMWWDLQANGFRREILRRKIDAALPGAVCEQGWKCALKFFYPAGTSWDAPDADPDGAPAGPIELPDAGVIDLRHAPPPPQVTPKDMPLTGSNNWVVAGTLTATGSGLLANDMHLTQRVPTIWYQARLLIAAGGGAPTLDLSGVTLPGTPLLTAGSNGRVAWGFTNSYGDWLEVERVECTAVDAAGMHTPQGTVPLTTVRESIRVHGAAAAEALIRSGPAGLLLRIEPHTRSCWFGSWIATVPEATNFNLMRLESAGSVAEALRLAPEIGIPGQNAMLADRDGHIGWAIFARIPRGTGPGRARAQDGFIDPAEQPHLTDPPSARLWSANARVSGDPRALEILGGHVASLGAGYDLGARAGQIRDDLLALTGGVQPADMLHVQLDDRARFLGRWQGLLLQLLDPAALEGHPERAQLRALIARWNARASIDSVGYRLVRGYHAHLQEAVWESLLTGLGIDREEEMFVPPQFEGALWELVQRQPLNLLAQPYASWREFLLAEVDATLADLRRSCPRLQDCTWGARNTVRIRHPLSAALPLLSGLLDMPTVQLPGDHDMPRVQERDFGQSERFAVSPGHEAQGYLELPGGQSGHPLSPYYRSGFMGFVRGEPAPFLPGPPQHTLTLTPD